MQENYTFLPYEKLLEINELPDPFLKPDGTRVSTAAEWDVQRDYLKAMLAHYLYGEMPPAPDNTVGVITASGTAYEGKAITETVHLTFGPDHCLEVDMRTLRPNKPGRFPVLIWTDFGERDICPVEEELLDRGVIIVRFNKESLGVDTPHFVKQSPALKAYPGYTWRAMAVWSWGFSRIIDYLLTTDYINPDQIAATGYSRNGKVALCAAIYDERITLCAPGGSGCGGSGSFRYIGDRLGENSGIQETIGSMSLMFPFWWADEIVNFGAARDSERPDFTHMEFPRDFMEMYRQIDYQHFSEVGPEFRLPFDMHFARALIAPRFLLTTDSMDDSSANPYGIQIIWRAAAEVFRFLGVTENNAMYFREGPHAFAYGDWAAISDFISDKFLQQPQKRTNVVTLKVPENPEAVRRNNMFPRWYFQTPHFSWRAPGVE